MAKSQSYALREPIEFAEHGPLFFMIDENSKRGYVEFSVHILDDTKPAYEEVFSTQLSEHQFHELRDMFDRYYAEY
jgi:hypothetical protein